MPRHRHRHRRRSTVDLLVLLVAATICAAILIAVLTVATIAIIHPDQDTGRAKAIIGNVITTMVGVLSGYLAGRTRTRQESDDA